jgi:RNA polymerase sigma-70 factor (family 1)
MPPGKENIAELVCSFQHGEEKGFTWFFNALYPALLYYAFRIVRDKAAAKEIVEESFIKLWERHATFNHHKMIKSWLYSTVHQYCVEWKCKHQNGIESNQQKNLQENTEIHVMQNLIRTEVAREMHNAITNLPPRCQEVFKLIYIQGKTIKQVAMEMQLSVHTIKNHRARGLTLLKRRVPEFLAVSPLLMLA